MVKLKHIIFLAAEISRAERSYCAGSRPLPKGIRLGLSHEEIQARELSLIMTELDMCDEFGNQWTELVPVPAGDPQDTYTATIRQISEQAYRALQAAVSTIATIAKQLYEVEDKQAESLPPPKIIGTLKLKVPLSLAPRLTPTPILRA